MMTSVSLLTLTRLVSRDSNYVSWKAAVMRQATRNEVACRNLAVTATEMFQRTAVKTKLFATLVDRLGVGCNYLQVFPKDVTILIYFVPS